MSKKQGLSLSQAAGRNKHIFFFGGNVFWVYENTRLLNDFLLFSDDDVTMDDSSVTTMISRNVDLLAKLLESRREHDHATIKNEYEIPEGEFLTKESTPVTREWLLKQALTVEAMQELQSLFMPSGGDDEGKIKGE